MTRKLSEYWQLIGVALFISLIVFVTADLISGKTVKSVGMVVDKIFRDEQTYVILETRTDGNGQIYSVPVVHYDPPSWSLMVRIKSGETFQISCNPDYYYRTSIGDQQPLKTREGGISHFGYFLRFSNDY